MESCAFLLKIQWVVLLGRDNKNPKVRMYASTDIPNGRWIIEIKGSADGYAMITRRLYILNISYNLLFHKFLSKQQKISRCAMPYASAVR